MYYRKDVLAKAGLQPPASWDDFLEVAAKVSCALALRVVAVRAAASPCYQPVPLLPRPSPQAHAAFAPQLNGTDMNEDGEPDYGVCLQRPRFCFNGFSLAAIWSSYTQSQGTKSGAFFDPDTMYPLANSSAMLRALELYLQLR